VNAYEVLSQIYRLLGEADDEALRGAYGLVDREEIREIIRALGAARAPLRGGRGRTGTDESTPSTSRLSKGSESAPLRSPTTLDTLLSSTQDVDPAIIERVLAAQGVDLHRQSTESRARFLKRVARYINNKLSPSERSALIRRLEAEVPANQTAGWLDLLGRSTRR
jgi:hypothetical protein